LDRSLGFAPVGLLLTRSIMRRYYLPKRLIDGGVSDAPLNLSQRFEFEDTPGKEFTIKQGDIASRSHLFSGTFVENVKWDIPVEGIDYGPNSLSTDSSSRGSLGVAGASQTWVVGQGFLKAGDLNLQKVLDGGREGDKIKITDSLV